MKHAFIKHIFVNKKNNPPQKCFTDLPTIFFFELLQETNLFFLGLMILFYFEDF